MWGVKLVSDSIGLWNLIILAVALVMGYFGVRSTINKATLDILKSTNEALKLSNEEQKKTYEKEIEKLKANHKVESSAIIMQANAQDRRIRMIETSSRRQEIILTGARGEITIMDGALQMSIQLNVKLGGENNPTFDRIMQLQEELRRHRIDMQIKLDEFDSQTSIANNWLTSHDYGQDVRSRTDMHDAIETIRETARNE